MSALPSATDQRAAVNSITGDPSNALKEGENEAYLIDLRWYDQFRSFVGLGSDAPGDVDVPPINNSALLRGKFINTAACEGVDFYVVCPALWSQLQEWYGGGPPVPVPVGRDRLGRLVAPSRFYIFTVSYRGEKRQMQFHNLNTGKDVNRIARKEFKVPDNVETRVVVSKGSSKSELNRDCLLKEAQLRDEDPVILDYKRDGRWAESGAVGAQSFYSSQKSRSMPFPPEKQTDSAPSQRFRGLRLPGVVGFDNLGNTCYFNSGLQCLVHTRPLASVFLSGRWRDDLNRTNPIGMRGALAEAFASVVNKVWSGSCFESFSPRDLKEVIGRFAHQFAGYQQQDSHELITFLLDGVHEDLNRCKKKPVVEAIVGDGTNDEEVAQTAWKRHKLRNDSVIVDMFHGQLRSELTCPECHCKTIVFDPFMTLSLPLQKPRHQTLNVVFVPFNVKRETREFRLTVTFDSDINAVVSEAVKRPVNVVMISHSSDMYGSYGFGIRETGVYDTYYAVEIPDPEKKYVLGRVRISREDLSVPIAVAVPDFDITEERLTELFREKLKRLLWRKEEGDDNRVSLEIEQEIQKIKGRQGTPVLTSNTERIAVRFRDYGMDRGPSVPLTATQVNANIANRVVMIYVNPQMLKSSGWQGIVFLNTQKKRSANIPRVRETVNLEKCFEYFSMAEVLDEHNQWFCPKCRQFVCAQKKMDIWRLPEIVIIQLKRFIGGRIISSKKFDGLVEFPDELDMGLYLAGPQRGEDIKYRLYGVSEHCGGLGGGHYTARARVAPKDQSENGGQWYYFNDSMSRKCSISDAHTTMAYILFYERITTEQESTD